METASRPGFLDLPELQLLQTEQYSCVIVTIILYDLYL
jgi:hypothetical protein